MKRFDTKLQFSDNNVIIKADNKKARVLMPAHSEFITNKAISDNEISASVDKFISNCKEMAQNL